MENPISAFPTSENDSGRVAGMKDIKSTQLGKISGNGNLKHGKGKLNGNEPKFALFDRSNVTLKKASGRCGTPKKALNYSHVSLLRKLLPKQEKSVNLSDDDDETDGVEPEEMQKDVGRDIQMGEEITSPSEVVATETDEEDLGFDENEIPPQECFGIRADLADEDYYATAPAPEDAYPKMRRHDVELLSDVDENGYPVWPPGLKETALKPFRDGSLSPAESLEWSYDYNWDQDSSGFADLSYEKPITSA